jgi:cytoskeletal protein CcmA (bactofilin family)
MVIAGDAKINGDAYLPERGIKMGNIQGYGYTKPQLVYGRKWQSKSRLPELQNGMVQQLKKMTNTGFMPTGNDFILKTGAMVKNGFEQETQIIRGVVVDLENVSLTGNIIVWASQQIKVHPSANLKDVVLVAPEINIADRVIGNFQALAGKQITVGRNCNLNYPTILAVQDTRKTEGNNIPQREPSLIMESGSSLSGIIVYHNEHTSKKYGADIQIGNNANVHGEIYCQGSLELKGSVFGSVWAQSFIALENGNVYLNHLYNGNIDAYQLPMEFGGLVFSDTPVNQVMKWLY